MATKVSRRLTCVVDAPYAGFMNLQLPLELEAKVTRVAADTGRARSTRWRSTCYLSRWSSQPVKHQQICSAAGSITSRTLYHGRRLDVGRLVEHNGVGQQAGYRLNAAPSRVTVTVFLFSLLASVNDWMVVFWAVPPWKTRPVAV